MTNHADREEARLMIKKLRKEFDTFSNAKAYLINQGFVQPERGQDNYLRLRLLAAFIYRYRCLTPLGEKIGYLITYALEPEGGLKIEKLPRGVARGAIALRSFNENGI